jgi:hypothetical protein
MTPPDAQPHADPIGAPPAVAVRLSDPAKVAHLMLVAALTSYDPGTEPWTVLHNAADEVNAAIATVCGERHVEFAVDGDGVVRCVECRSRL